MEETVTWLSECIESLRELGGIAQYAELYQKIKERGKMPLSEIKDWKASIRWTIELNSSDSKIYKGKGDYFYSVDGIGKGKWGLRENWRQESTDEEEKEELSFSEGKKVLKQHFGRERNSKVIKIAKQNFKKAHGRLFCEVCEFDFEKFYGEIGKDFIEGHHTIPVSELKEEERTKPEDIMMVCSNCHRMIHKSVIGVSKEAMKDFIKNSMRKEQLKIDIRKKK